MRYFTIDYSCADGSAFVCAESVKFDTANEIFSGDSKHPVLQLDENGVPVKVEFDHELPHGQSVRPAPEFQTAVDNWLRRDDSAHAAHYTVETAEMTVDAAKEKVVWEKIDRHGMRDEYMERYSPRGWTRQTSGRTALSDRRRSSATCGGYHHQRDRHLLWPAAERRRVRRHPCPPRWIRTGLPAHGARSRTGWSTVGEPALFTGDMGPP